MGKSIKVHLSQGYQLRQKGVFNLKKIYGEMDSWLKENEYKYAVTYHSHKKLDKGDEIILSWEAERDITEFVRFQIKIDFRFNKIFPESDNLVSGHAKITFKAFIIPDYKKNWEDSKFKQFLCKLYTKIFYRDKLIEYYYKLDAELKDLFNVAKEVLDFYR